MKTKKSIILNMLTLTCLVSHTLIACGPADMSGYDMDGEEISISDASNTDTSELRKKRKAFLKYLTCEDRNLDSYSAATNVNTEWNDYVLSTLTGNNIPTASALQQGFEAMYCDANDPFPIWAGGTPLCRLWPMPQSVSGGSISYLADANNPAVITYSGCVFKEAPAQIQIQ